MKLLGYRYDIVERFPTDDGAEGIRFIESRDNLKDATEIAKVLEATDIDWTVYSILLTPVWSNK